MAESEGEVVELPDPAVAAEEICECVQVVVEEGEDPGKVLGPEEQLRAVQAVGLSEEMIRSIAQADTVYYVQPDGSLVQGGGLTEELQPSPGIHTADVVSVSAGPSVQPPVGQRRQTVTQSTPSSISRLFNHKHLKSICIQVPGLGTKINREPEVPPVYSSLGTESVNLHGAQILQIGQLSPYEHQRIFLHSSTQNPIPVVAAQPSLQPAPEIVLTNQDVVSTDINTVASNETTDPVPPVEPAPDIKESGPTESAPKEDQKSKKSLKIKTRSGRISRPPKHKAKDYKFIRMGDLAYGHQSDSDDYSELSVEDDPDISECVSFDTQSFNLKPKLFHCDTCDKSYIGKGGLSRHYKLYPEHGRLESLEQQIISVTATNGDLHFEFANDTANSDGADASNATAESQDVTSTANAEEPQVSVSNQQPGASEENSSPPETQQANKPSPPNTKSAKCKENETPKVPKRRGRPRVVEPSTEKRKRPQKILRALSPEESEIKRRDHLRELLKQFRMDDLKDMVLPRLTKLVTVYEFLLLKIEQDCQQEATFPRVYAEFEQLHYMVKVMARDYLDRLLLNHDKSLQIKQTKVAESLAFPQEVIRRHKPISRSSASDKLNSKEKQNPVEKEELPPMKKIKLAGYSSGADTQQHSLGMSETTQNESTTGQLDKTPESFGEGFSAINVTDTEYVAIRDEAMPLDSQEKLPPDLEATSESGNTNAVLYQTQIPPSEVSPSPAITKPLACPIKSEEILSVHKFVENFVHKKSGIVPGLPSSVLFPPETTNYVCSPITSEPRNPGHCLDSSGHPSLEKNMQIAVRDDDNTFATNVIWDHTYRACKDNTQIPAVQGSAFTFQGAYLDGKRDLENRFLDQRETTIEVSSENHGLFTQANEQIFYQTADGLLLPHSAIAGLSSHPDSIVILTDTGGTAMHFETVEALLQMETK